MIFDLFAANNTWKTLRKAAMTMLKPDNAELAKTLQRAEAAQLMWDMLNNPDVSAKSLEISTCMMNLK